MLPATRKWLSDNTGKKVGKLTITGKFQYKKNNLHLECLCDCGKTCYIYKSSLTKESPTTSCGCDTRSKFRQTFLDRHGVENPSQSPEIKAKVKQTNLERHGVEHASQSPKFKEKIKQTNLERYGVESPAQSREVREKIKRTTLERHGVEHPMYSPELKAKVKRTNLERYGVEHPMYSSEVKEKIRQTNLERHGVENPSQSPKIQEKVRQTNLERHGVEHPMQSLEFKEKTKQTNLERYGVANPFQSPEIQEKIRATFAQKDYSSGPELELANFIRSLGYNAEKSYCGGANPCEIDIRVMDQTGNTVLCLEYNGDYFHSEARSGHRNYHLNKTMACAEQKKTHLIHVFDSEWQTKQEIVKNFIRSKLEKGVSVRASKCEVLEITQEVAFAFCEANHLQGRPNSAILCLGLFHDNQLLSVATFSKPHRQNMKPYPHLSRYAILPGFRIHGGLSKLSQYAFGILGEFITFVHYRLSDGKSYEKAGYTNLGLSKPDYWYWDTRKDKIASKQSRRKSAMKTPPNMSESEHAAQDGLYKVWDCGKIKFIYSPK